MGGLSGYNSCFSIRRTTRYPNFRARVSIPMIFCCLSDKGCILLGVGIRLSCRDQEFSVNFFLSVSSKTYSIIYKRIQKGEKKMVDCEESESSKKNGKAM